MNFSTDKNDDIGLKLAENLAKGPSGGRSTMWLGGVCVAVVPFVYGVWCLITGHALMFGRHDSVSVTGSPAVALAIAYMSAGLFAHFHWFWGLHPRLGALSQLGKIVSLAVFLCSLGFAIFKIVEM